jgi:hypothetical protein
VFDPAVMRKGLGRAKGHVSSETTTFDAWIASKLRFESIIPTGKGVKGVLLANAWIDRADSVTKRPTEIISFEMKHKLFI